MINTLKTPEKFSNVRDSPEKKIQKRIQFFQFLCLQQKIRKANQKHSSGAKLAPSKKCFTRTKKIQW